MFPRLRTVNVVSLKLRLFCALLWRSAVWNGLFAMSADAVSMPRSASGSPPWLASPSGALDSATYASGLFVRALLVSAAYAISGLFDLGPMVGTSVNKALGLDAEAARAASPLYWRPPAHGTLDALVGENESAEYHRQSRIIVDGWGKAGLATRFGAVPGANHFTAIAPLSDPNSPMVSRLKELAQR